MPAPDITFSVTGNKVSSVTGHDHITLTFSADIAYTQCEIRATKNGTAYGRGVGTLIASFSTTPANTSRSVDVYDSFLVNGDGDYRVSIFAQSEDGGWNDNCLFVPSGSDGLITADSKTLLSMR